MKRMLSIMTLAALLPVFAQAQFRGSEPVKAPVSESVIQQPGSLFDIIDLNRFSMQHSISMSYNTIGNQSIGLTKYTNSINYRISQPFSLRADISMQYSPFNSLPQAFKNDFNKIYLERAQLEYRPSDDFRVTLQYRNYQGYYYPGDYMRSGIFPVGMHEYDDLP